MVVEPTNFIPLLRTSADGASDISEVTEVWSYIVSFGQKPQRYASKEPNSSCIALKTAVFVIAAFIFARLRIIPGVA